MIKKYNTLTLNGKQYSASELIVLADNISLSESVPGWYKKIYLFIREWLSETETMEARTSGSTGAPKTIRIEKSMMVKSAERTGRFLKLKRGDQALLCLPIDFIAGKMMVVRSFVLGLDLQLVNPSSIPLKGYINRIDFAAMTPMQVHFSLSEPSGKTQINQIKTLLIGGGDIAPGLMKALAILSNDMYLTYGMTETLTHVAMKKITGVSGQQNYQTMPGVEIESDQEGRLVITDNFLGLKRIVSNDIVELISETEFRFLGRYDHVINTGGIKVIPEVVENKLLAQIENRVVIAGIKDDVFGSKVIAIIETARAGFPDNLELHIENAGLKKYETPKEIFYVDRFPESQNGKIKRRQLLAMIGK